MSNKRKKHPLSLNALIEQTARILRNAVKKPKQPKSKKAPLSKENRIEQIALLLRTEAKKLLPKKKKID